MEWFTQVDTFLRSSSEIGAFAPIFQLGCAFNIALDRWRLRYVSVLAEIAKIKALFQDKLLKLEIDPADVEDCGLTTSLTVARTILKAIIVLLGFGGKYLAILVVFISFGFLLFTGFNSDSLFTNLELILISLSVTILPLFMFWFFNQISLLCNKLYGLLCDKKIKSFQKLKTTFSPRNKVLSGDLPEPENLNTDK